MNKKLKNIINKAKKYMVFYEKFKKEDIERTRAIDVLQEEITLREKGTDRWIAGIEYKNEIFRLKINSGFDLDYENAIYLAKWL